MEGMDRSMMNDVKYGNRKPFMALLFTCLLNIHTMLVHLPYYDAFLGLVLKGALANQTKTPTM